jgi:hypothetical protein
MWEVYSHSIFVGGAWAVCFYWDHFRPRIWGSQGNGCRVTDPSPAIAEGPKRPVPEKARVRFKPRSLTGWGMLVQGLTDAFEQGVHLPLDGFRFPENEHVVIHIDWDPI